MVKKIILLAALFCLLQGQALAGEYVADGIGVTEKAALQDAFRTAMENVIGMKIDSRTYARNHQIIRDQILAHTEGYVRSYEILRRSTSGDMVAIRCRVIIDTEPNAELMTKLEKLSAIKIGLNDPRIAVLIINGDDAGKNADEAAAVILTSVLANNGFSHIIDIGQLARSQQEQFKAAAFEGDYATIALLGIQEELDYIILGTIKANNVDLNVRTPMVTVKSARAFLNEKVIKTGTGAVVQSGQYQECGTDIVAENARQTAKKHVSTKAGNSIASALLNNAAMSTKNITVYVHGLKDHSELQAYEAMLHDLLGITDVYIRNFINGSAVLDLSFSGDTEELATRIGDSDDGFVSLVSRLTDSTLDLVVKKTHK